MWCAGRKKKSPGFVEAVFSPCISISSGPPTTSTLASAECQCLRLSHPGSSFTSTLEGPLLGSPCSTATVKQSGTLGRVANFASADFVATSGWPDCWANAAPVKNNDTLSRSPNTTSTARFLCCICIAPRLVESVPAPLPNGRSPNEDNTLSRWLTQSPSSDKRERRNHRATALVQRCMVHKRRNLLQHLPPNRKAYVSRMLSVAWSSDSALLARRRLKTLLGWLENNGEHGAARVSARAWKRLSRWRSSTCPRR